ncbi:hypothetical protein GH714_015611 [Hevea brasiliensis]|uniref:Uncharacterized protein n=1 Tax=Hevea brasiliensis TaxID=3981 RepID=A0A6A6MA61_HEVBR|nr:hypothetical protein GH714_015611 [Hevea brasiliensis]
MPRPGPRPYECVRRAWHSDRHQPMRGSIIQQIFRVAKESHSAATKKNREWQEKLPTVVLKAEEIMYSKANSEAEYMNLETLWDRVNDALTQLFEEMRALKPESFCLLVLKSASLQSSCQLNFARATKAVNSTFPVSECNRDLSKASKLVAPQLYENISAGCSQLMSTDTDKQLNLGSVYPLYYGNNYHNKDPHLASQVAEKNPNIIYVGNPISTSMGALQNLFLCPSAEIAAKRISQANLENTQGKSPGVQCDLSLRLGLYTDPCISMERGSAQETEVVVSSSSQDRGKLSDFSLQKNKDLCLSRITNTNDPFMSCPIKCFSVGEDQSLDTTMRKRKALFNDNMEDGQFCWQPEFPSNQFIGRIERPGL